MNSTASRVTDFKLRLVSHFLRCVRNVVTDVTSLQKMNPFVSTSSTQPTEFAVPDRIITILYSSTWSLAASSRSTYCPHSYDFSVILNILNNSSFSIGPLVENPAMNKRNMVKWSSTRCWEMARCAALMISVEQALIWSMKKLAD